MSEHGRASSDGVETSGHRETLQHSRGLQLETCLTVPDVLRDNWLHVFHHGQLDRATFVPPVFHRRRSSARLGAVCLFLSDPVLRVDPSVTIGWYLLGDDEFWPQLEGLVGDALKRYGLRGVMWHGPSAGGYAAVRNCLRSPFDTIGFAVAPQNNPKEFLYWREFEAIHRATEPDGDVPHLDRVIAALDRHERKLVYLVVNSGDAVHLKYHIKPIFDASTDDARVYISLLPNGRGHTRIDEADYWAGVAHAKKLFDVQQHHDVFDPRTEHGTK